MRMVLGLAVLPLGVPVLIACGASHGPSDGARSASESSASAAPSESSAAGDPAGPTTTTATLGDGGDGPGAKLADARTVASASASAAAPSKAPHSHDPGRDTADIRAIIVAHRDEARACYDRALPNHPGLEGDLVIKWTIDPKGNVTQVSSDTSRSQIAESTVVTCITDIIKKIQFASSPGGFETKASYPFNFHPHHGQPAAGGQ
jgi:hypothetical protein